MFDPRDTMLLLSFVALVFFVARPTTARKGSQAQGKKGKRLAKPSQRLVDALFSVFLNWSFLLYFFFLPII
jgi:hypothetical protein